MFVDDLAQEIRSVNGNGALGASALAEALAPFILNRLSMAEAAPSEAAEGELEELCNSWFQRGFSGALEDLRSHINMVDPNTNDPCDTCWLTGPDLDHAIVMVGYFSDLGAAARFRETHGVPTWPIWWAQYDTEYGDVIKDTPELVVF